MSLSPCQQSALKLLNENQKNFFLTGQAGTGKSFLIRNFLKNKDRKVFPIVASTGAAAVLVGGRTFHSFFGLGIMEGGVEKTIARALANKRIAKRLRKIDGFVLDEVSMISGPALRAAENICSTARKSKLPWGGAQVIAVGDFAQLPPINRFSEQKEWAFLDETWNKSKFISLNLKSIMRSQDQTFTKVLNLIREGKIDEEVRAYLNTKIIVEHDPQKITNTTHLFPHRETVEKFNLRKLSEINKPLKEITTLYTGEDKALEQIKRNAPIPDVLQIKESALVMIRQNDTHFEYVNGSLGTITKITEETIKIKLKNGNEVELEKAVFSLLDAEGEVIATANNFPITLAYATTIHKAQGATLDELVCDLRKLWEAGQAYVALSRLRKGEGLKLIGWDEDSFHVDEQVLEFYRNLD
ncbi:MAG: AAA family ATPase [Deltaproteobacteria bacterium]|nr:AAA family ATPase [Deltaproteobacteria bacterium]